MQNRGRRAALGWIGVALLMAPCGCATLGTLKGRDAAAADEPAANAIQLASAKEAYLPPADPAADRVSRQLALSEDQRKALALRVQQLQAVLEEKDAALAQADHELQAANAEINHTREDLKRWKQETVSLREKLSKSEEETLSALQSVVPTLERMSNNK